VAREENEGEVVLVGPLVNHFVEQLHEVHSRFGFFKQGLELRIFRLIVRNNELRKLFLKFRPLFLQTFYISTNGKNEDYHFKFLLYYIQECAELDGLKELQGMSCVFLYFALTMGI